MPERSRSPNGWSDWISKSVVSFARYAPKRPSGLVVDDNGGFRLTSLMAAWGHENRVTSEQVLQAVRNNMYARSGVQRFELVELADGDYLISACDRRGGAAEDTPQNDRSWDKGGKSWSSTKSWDKDNDTWNGSSSSWQKWEKQNKTSWEKEGTAWDSKSPSSWNQEGKWASSSSWNQRDRQRSDKDNVWAQKHPETIQRWVGWLLKGGYSDLGIARDNAGWASAEELAAAMAKQKPEFGISDGMALRELIESTDTAGRFEFDAAGRVRKVARDQRQWSRVAADAHREPPVKLSVAVEPEPTSTPPPKPPGPYWTEYVDQDVYWHYYEGPLGKWWMSDTDAEPIPWTDA